MDAKVLEVTSVSFALAKSNPPGLVVWAQGKVSSSGWSRPRLVPYVYVVPPADGIWDFDFIARPPEGIALTVISPIAADAFIFPAPSWCVGVRVHGGSNAVASNEADPRAAAATLFAAGERSAGRQAVAEGIDLFPWTVRQGADASR